MKRLCAVAILEYPKKDVRYLAAMLRAWEHAGVETCIISNDAAVLRQLPAFALDDLRQAVSYAESCACGEIIVITDDLMGPVTELSDLLVRADAAVGGLWQLTQGAPMFGVRRDAWERLAACSDLQALSADCRLYDTADLHAVTAVPMLDEPLLLARDRGCPFFLHEVFHRDYGDVLNTTLGHQGQVFYSWLMKESAWDTDLLWDYLLPTYDQFDYFLNMHLEYVLPTKGADRDWTREHLKTHPLALVMHLYYPDKLQESFSYARRFPEQTHVIVTTSSEEKRQRILEVFSKKKFASLDVRVIGNRGRDVSALLVGAAEVFDRYEYVCFFHDKKSAQLKPGSIGAGFAYKLQENLFPTGDFVANVIRLFHENRRLGILMPPPPNHGEYFFTLGCDWGPNYEITKQLADRLCFDVPISEDKMPVSPLGTCFWFRGRALRPLSGCGWQYSDFPPEPNNVDGTLLHAIERLYSFAAVEAGYYPAFMMSDRYAAIEYSTMRYYVREFNKICISHDIISYQRDMCAELGRQLRR